MKVESINIHELHFDPSNSRKHDSKNMDAIKGSLARFGQQKPIVIGANGVVIAGNGTLAAAKALGWEAINVVKTELEGAEKIAFGIADNKTADLAEWDNEILAKTLSALQIEDEALLEAAGFDEDELTALVNEVTGMTKGNTDPDEVPDIPQEPLAKMGQIWRLGNHRLMCGDSTSSDNVGALMNGERADSIVTDPPYGIGISSNPVRQAHAKSDWDNKPVDPTPMIGETPAIVWGGNYFPLPPGKGFLVWDKKQPENFTLAMCEMAWTNVDTPAKMFRKSVTSYEKEHPTQKPVELLAWCLSFVDGSVFDPFLGSGTTLIACEQAGRACYGMELSPAYCDVIIKRWQDFTGKTAALTNG